MKVCRTAAVSALLAALVVGGPLATSASARTAASPVAASTLAAASAEYPHPDYEARWHDGANDGFTCDYWYFDDPAEGGSGKDWSGWHGRPQLHFLHHTIVEDDGTTSLAYDRDIAGSWWHAWGHAGGEVVHADPEGMGWDNTGAHQTILLTGYAGGADLTERAASARALLARAGVTSDRSATDDRVAAYTAYEATQMAVWYFSSGRDVMELFFDVDAANEVTLSDLARTELAGGWQFGTSDRLATLEVAAWLIETALTGEVALPEPGFVSIGFLGNADGSTDYGFTATLTGGTGDVQVELRTADGSALPAGIELVDAQGEVTTSVTPGQKVSVRVPAGTDVQALPSFELWGAAAGSTSGSPRFYTGQDLSTMQEHSLIGLGDLDQPSVAWGWAGVTLADVPEGTEDPEGPADPVDPAPGDTGTTDPTDPAPGDESTPAPSDSPSTDPADLGLDDTEPVADVAAPEQKTGALASTGGNTVGLLAAGALVVLAGAGLFLASRRRRAGAR